MVPACACLLCSDIAKLWEVAGRRYDADPAEAQSVTQGRRIWDEMPQLPGEVRAGWAAVPDCLPRLKGFLPKGVLLPQRSRDGLKLGGSPRLGCLTTPQPPSANRSPAVAATSNMG